MNKLYIDTRNNKHIIIKIKTDSEEFVEEDVAVASKAQTILPLVEKVLEKAQLKTSDIDEIEVEKGPGAYTGLRVGITIANTLGFASGIKINGKKIGEIELPSY